ncbi:MAG: hydantoinase/oxoprolinase family protein [bacterium]
MIYLGIDTGGTFTDFVLLRDGEVSVHKVLSTPAKPEQAILQGIHELGLDAAEMRVVHGSTVATNAALEGKGVDTLFVTNRGFTDLLSIGRQAREQLYDLQPEPQSPPVPPDWCLGVGGRLNAQGSELEPLTDTDLQNLKEAFTRLKPEAVAINLLFSYLDDEAERRLAAVLPDTVFVSLSSQVLPEIREYERGMATWLNAWVGPLVEGYLQRLDGELPTASVSVMQSSGDTVAAQQAAKQAVRMLLSGPAGGLVGARMAAATGKEEAPRLLTFDMGGTSTDVALIDGEPRLTSEGKIGRFPVAVPMVDMHTIGAGGGSIAWLDAGGMLQVGPESAGAAPGPACYGNGGTQATVTDANLVLGRLRPDAFLGGRMSLDVEAANTAVDQLASAMDCDRITAAEGIIAIANEHMAQALRHISSQRGIDPESFTLVSFGGAGGLHVCALAEALGMPRAMVPVHAGVLSALGMLGAKPGRRLSRTSLTLLQEQDDEQVQRQLDDIAMQGCAELQEEGISAADCKLVFSLDLRYQGQSYTLEIPWQSVDQAIQGFHDQHRDRYGHELNLPVELVNLRVAVSGPAPGLKIRTAAPTETGISLPLDQHDLRCYRRDELAIGQRVVGPAIITEEISTTWLAEGWQCERDEVGNLMLSRAVQKSISMHEGIDETDDCCSCEAEPYWTESQPEDGNTN